MMRQRVIKVTGTFESQMEATRSIAEAGDVAVVERGKPRLIVMRCPDGCGETIRINLDKQVDKAWRIYRDEDGLSLYPSVWRNTGCESHFIIWSDKVIWCDRRDVEYRPRTDQRLRTAVHDVLRADRFQDADEIAEFIGTVPWTISFILDGLVDAGKVETRLVQRRKEYRLK